jgi:hypothetical protein
MWSRSALGSTLGSAGASLENFVIAAKRLLEFERAVELRKPP